MSAIALQVAFVVGGESGPTPVKLTTALERAGLELADVGKHVLPKVLPLLEGSVAKQFDTEGAGPVSGSWAPLSTSYARWKAANYPGQPKLVATGAMRAALTDGSAPGALREVSGDTLAYGTRDVPYASYHQTGTGKMPARPPFDFGTDFERGMTQAAAAGAREAVREASDGLLDFTGPEFEGLPVETGTNGGRFVRRADGRRTYLKQDKSGRVHARTFGRKK